MEERDFATPYNVVAAFRHEPDSDAAVSVLTAKGVPPAAIRVHRPVDGLSADEVAEVRAEMQDELDESWSARFVAFVRGGFGQCRPRVVGQEVPLPAEQDVLVAVHAADPRLAERAAAVLRRLGAERVHLVDAHGVPLPPQAEHPRPADPEGWWWQHAGSG